MKNKTPEPDTMSGIYEDLLADLEELTSWAKGEQELKTTTLSSETAAERTPLGGVLVGLEPDVAAAFPTSAAVNEALRLFIKMTGQKDPVEVDTDKRVLARSPA